MNGLPADAARSDAETLARTMLAAGHRGPLLVVADNAMIGRRARVWADVFSAHGWLHRVRLSEGGDDLVEIAALVREAQCLGAAAVFGSGGASTRSAGARAAAEAGLPFISDVTDADSYGRDGPECGRGSDGLTPRD